MKVTSDIRYHSYWKPDSCHTVIRDLLKTTWLIETLSLIGCQADSEWVQWNSLKIHQKILCPSGSTFVWKLRDEIWLNILQRIRRVLLSLLQSQHKSFPQTSKPQTDELWKKRRTLTGLTKLSAPINRDPAERPVPLINKHNGFLTLLAVFDS